MKIISLNTWGGRAGKENLLEFFRIHQDVDVFCLQEIWSAPYEHLDGHKAGGLAINHDDVMVYGMQEISKLLSGHQVFFHPHHLDNYGLMMLVKKDLKVVEEGDIFVYKERGHIPSQDDDIGNHARNIQYVTIETEEGRKTFINFHGLWMPGSVKTDTPDRLKQSENIIEFLETIKNPYIFCGDFNLTLNTESIKKFETFGLKNLIRDNGITSTRTHHYTRPERFADYIFVSQDVEVKDFKVLPDEVSDHSPMYL